MTTRDLEAPARGRWCAGPLPAPGERLAVVRPSDGATLPTCSAPCMAALVTDLVGHSEPDRRDGAGRNTRTALGLGDPEG